MVKKTFYLCRHSFNDVPVWSGTCVRVPAFATENRAVPLLPALQWCSLHPRCLPPFTLREEPGKENEQGVWPWHLHSWQGHSPWVHDLWLHQQFHFQHSVKDIIWFWFGTLSERNSKAHYLVYNCNKYSLVFKWDQKLDHWWKIKT